MAGPGNQIDASIPLAVKSPLESATQWTDLQAKQAATWTAQQTFAARQKAGQILATSSDLESGLEALYRDPLVAPFAPAIVNSVREGQRTLVELQGKQQEQAQSGLAAALKALPAVAAGGDWDKTMNAQLATMSAHARSKVAPALEAIKQSILDGTEGLSPEDRQRVINHRTVGLMAASGVTPELMTSLYGKPETKDTGDYLVPGVQAPSHLGGGFFPAQGTELGKGLPPTVVQGEYGPGGAPQASILGGGRPSQGSGGASVPNPLMPGGNQGSGAARGTGLLGLPQQTREYNKQRLDEFSKYEKTLEERVLAGQSQRRNMDEIIEAAKQAHIGGGAPTMLRLGKLLQAFGVSNETVDKMANGSAPASEVIDKSSLTNMMTQLRQQLAGVGGSRINMQEFVAFLSKNPNLATDPRAMVQIFNLWNSYYKRDLAELHALDEYKSRGGDLTRWPAHWSKSDKMKEFAPDTDISSEGVKGTGAAAAGATHRWVPGQGLVPIGPGQ